MEKRVCRRDWKEPVSYTHLDVYKRQVPICPRFVFSPFLEESDAEDMQGYGRMSHILLRRCRMVVVCGKEVTGTMNTEISMADRLHIICTTLDGLVQIKESK